MRGSYLYKQVFFIAVLPNSWLKFYNNYIRSMFVSFCLLMFAFMLYVYFSTSAGITKVISKKFQDSNLH